jgi:hypothetical protein
MIPRVKNQTLLIPVFLTILLVIAFYDVVFLNKTFKVTTANSQALPTGAYGQENNKPKFIPVNGTDSPVMEEPVYEFIKLNLRKGILPLWNPHQACGYPLIGMIEVGMFYPLMFILYLLPELFAWDIMILARFLVAGCFTYWFMRTLGLKTIPSLCSAVAFMLSGPLLSLQYWTTNVDITTPLILLSIERLLRKKRPVDTALLSAAVTLSVLGGHPEHILLVNVYCLCFFLYRVFVLRHSVSPQQAVKHGLLAYLLAAGLSAFITFPFFKNLLFEFWHGHPPQVGLLLEEQRSRALSLVIPYFFQKVPLTYQWMFSGWWGGYIGLLPFALTFMSFFNNHKRHANSFFALMAFLIISKQYALPYINWIGHLPGFSVCRFAPHTPVLAAFSLAVCAGMGTRGILNSRNLFLKGIPFSLLLIGIVTAHLLLLQNPDGQPQALRASLAAFSLIVVFQGLLFCRDKKILTRTVTGLLLLAVLFVELFSHIHRERPFRFRSFGEVPYINFIKDQPQRVRSYGNFWAFYPNTASGFEVDDLGFFFGLVPKRFVRLVNTLFVPNHFRGDLRPPALRAIPLPYSENILDLLNVRYIIKPTDSTFEKKFPHLKNVTKNYTRVYRDKVEIYERPRAYPRAFIVHKAIFQTDDEQSLRVLQQLKDQTRHVAVINHPPVMPVQQLLKSTPIEDGSAVNISQYSANQVALGVNMQSPGFLILSDAYHPDWKVYVNGKPSKIFRTDYFIRSVFLPAGHHRVRFVFSPASFKIGIMVSLVSLLLLLFLSTRQSGRLPSPRWPQQNPGAS